MKNSLLKWLSHLYKGTTYGYATRKDCLVAFGFLLLFILVLSFLFYLIGTILNGFFTLADPYPTFISIVPFILTIIATYSLIFMRINDIYGKRFFTTKGLIFVFFGVCFLIEIFGRVILKVVFDIQPIDSAGWSGLLFWFIICVCPPSSKEREEMPIVEYRLPKKAIAVLIAITAITYGLLLYEAINDPKVLNAALVETADEVNKDLPIMIDSETRLDGTVASYKTFIFLYTIINVSEAEIDVYKLYNNLYPEILNNIKTNSDLKIFRDNKVTMVYLYRDKNGNKIVEFRFGYEDYREDKPMLDTTELWDSEEIDPIIVDYTETLKINPNDYELLILRGDVYFNKGDLDRAIADYNEALRVKPDAYETLYNRGLAYAIKGDYDRAIEDYNATLRIKFDFYQVLNSRGLAYAAKGDYDRAIEDYIAAIRIKPDSHQALNYRGLTYATKGNYDRAIEDYNSALRIKPDDQNALYNRGNAYYEKGNYDKAIEDYNEALRIKPDDHLALHDRGNAYYYKDNYDQAIEDYDAALRIKPNYQEALYNRGNAYYKKGNYDQAIEDYNAALRIKPNYQEALYNRGLAYADKGSYDQAIEDFTAALRIKPDYLALHNRGLAYADKGNYDQAIEDYTVAIKIKPDNYGDLYNRGNTYYKKGNYDQAIEDYNAVLRIKPDYQNAIYNRGNAYYKKGNYDRAIDDFEVVLQIDPNNVNARKSLEETRKKSRGEKMKD